ncbi:MAG: ClpX C4-type zinc finger protein [Phycisphaerales bacterium]
MHDPNATGNEFFRCDFCLAPWAEDRPMVEGHQGSLICARCLTACYTEVVVLGGGAEHTAAKCAMCLESRPEAKWQSPLASESHVCRRCIRQSTVMLERDEESGWRRPTGGPPAGAQDDDGDDED